MTIGDFTGGGHTINVSTEVMITKAAEVEDKVENMRKRLEEMEDIIVGTRTYWIGEAGDLHRDKYISRKDEISEILQRLAEHPVNLRTVAQQIYGGLINENKEIIVNLPGDAIS